MKENMENIEDIYRVLDAIETSEGASQRALSHSLGYSLGKVNYLLKGLAEKGWIKLDNFSKSSNKMRYAFVLTPQGIKEKLIITKAFLKRREEEYERMNIEIQELRKKIDCE